MEHPTPANFEQRTHATAEVHHFFSGALNLMNELCFLTPKKQGFDKSESETRQPNLMAQVYKKKSILGIAKKKKTPGASVVYTLFH